MIKDGDLFAAFFIFGALKVHFKKRNKPPKCGYFTVQYFKMQPN